MVIYLSTLIGRLHGKWGTEWEMKPYWIQHVYFFPEASTALPTDSHQVERHGVGLCLFLHHRLLWSLFPVSPQISLLKQLVLHWCHPTRKQGRYEERRANIHWCLGATHIFSYFLFNQHIFLIKKTPIWLILIMFNSIIATL